MKKYISKTEQGYHFLDFGYEVHGKRSFRLWVSKDLIKKDKEGREYVDLPCQNCRIIKTKKGNFVLIPAEGWNVFEIGWSSGYRGRSSYEILTELREDDLVLDFYEYRSPVGSLGISNYALVSTSNNELIVELTTTGRTYGSPKNMTMKYYFENGEQKEREEIIDKELKEII